MGNGIMLFNYNGKECRTHIDENGNPWWVAKDVCQILGLKNVSESLDSLEEDEKAAMGISYRSSNGVEQKRNVCIVSESGLYALIFKSRKMEARNFRKWVTSVMLPEIRKNGSYSSNMGRVDQLSKCEGLLEDCLNRITELEKALEEREGKNKSSISNINGVEPFGKLLSVSAIGNFIGLSAHMVNSLLIELGYQKFGTYPTKYEPTENGKRWCKIFEGNGWWQKHLDVKATYPLWYASIVENLKNKIRA